MKRLHDARFLDRLARRAGGVRAGSDGYVYGLGPSADRLLHPGQPRRRSREVSDGFLLHTLAISDVYVSLARQSSCGRLSLLHLQTEPLCWRRLNEQDDDWLKPDLLVVVETSGQEFHSFVEVDRGSEHAPALLRKLRTYELAYRLGVVAVEQEVFPRVVWLVPDDRRASQLQRLISNSGALTTELHLVARHEQAVAALSGGSHEESRGGNPQTGVTP